MTLKTYHRKRKFDQTPEPEGQVVDTDLRRFVVQEHHATQLHYDFRLEMGGVLVSWAIPKGPSLDPAQRRLAVKVEDHPVDYKDGQVRLMSRNDKELGFRYPELAGLRQWVRAGQAILDGEIVVLDDDGRSDFQRLQARLGLPDAEAIERLAAQHPVTYIVFDLLYYDGFDLRAGELIRRKTLLRAIIQPGAALRYSEHVVGDGEKAFREAQSSGLEGIIAKQQDSPYMEGRSAYWLKLKTVQRQEVVLGGYTQPRQTRQFLGALVVGLYRGKELHYVGHVGGGFNRESLAQVHEILQPLKTERSPFVETPRTNEPVRWVRPERVAEVKFATWTADNRLRQPIFLGLRDDKDPRQCTFERPQMATSKVRQAEGEVKAAQKTAVTTSSNGRAERSETRARVQASKLFERQALSGDVDVVAGRDVVSLTSLDRVYWPDEGYTKADLLRYYWHIADVILPHLKDRPLILKRYPNGIDQPSFFQHDVKDVPNYVRTITLESEEGRQIDYVLCQNRATLLYLVNMGTLAQNPWHSRVDRLEHPDWMVFDLDPGQVKFQVVCEAALAVKSVLDRLGLEVYAKTSGSRGLHLYVPLKPVYPYEQVAEFAEGVARLVARERPDIATVERSKKKRPEKKVYVDFLQNAYGKSVASPYSVRAKAGATVSAPLDWREVKRCPELEAFTIKTMPRRLARKGDLFKPALSRKQSLEGASAKLDELVKEAATQAKKKRG
jgi:bifunctional non-homologous end joining protein LigD